MDKLSEDGFVVIPKVYTLEECQLLTTSVVSEVIDITLRERGASNLFDDDNQNLQFLTDPDLRKLKLKNPNIIWRNGSSRTPIISKNCGIIDIHYNLDVLELVTLDERMYRLLSAFYGKSNLCHLEGPERISVKPKGSTNMPQHIDSNLFHPEVNFKERIQSLVCISIDPQAERNPKNCGTLCVLKNFHWYFALASKLFHPKTGLKPFPKDILGRYFLLPEDFDKTYLPVLKEHINGYTNYLHNREIAKVSNTFYEDLQKSGIVVPEKVKSIEWTPVVCKPGDVICWNQRLPHYNLRNKLEVPRIVCYYSVFPVSSGDKDKLDKCKKMFQNNAFYEQGTTIKNLEEFEYIHKWKFNSKIQEILNKSSLSRKLCGYEPW